MTRVARLRTSSVAPARPQSGKRAAPVTPHPHLRPSGVRLSPHHERWTLGLSLALVISGALWLVFHYWVAAAGEYGDRPHPLETWWLRAHGAAAFGFLVLLGTLLPVHMRRAWNRRRNHRSGAFVVTVVIVLVVTGYALYYLSSEELRAWISVTHWLAGLAGLPALALHAWFGQRRAARRQSSQAHIRSQLGPQVDGITRTGS
jgi:heme A synthase